MLHLKRGLSQSMIHNASLCTVLVSLCYMTTQINVMHSVSELKFVLYVFFFTVGLINLPLEIAKA